LLFRLTSTSGTYFEIGPQFGFLSTVEEDFEPTTGIGYEGLDTKDIYNSTNIAAIIGFGVDIDVTEKIFITTGIRLGYGITDITEENAVYTYLRGPSGWAQREDSFGALDYSATNRVFGGLNLGVSYKFGGE
jgi:hypothetical protein